MSCLALRHVSRVYKMQGILYTVCMRKTSPESQFKEVALLKQSMIIIMTVRARRRGGYRRGSGKILQLAACALLFLAAAAVRTFELGGDELKNSFLTQLEHSIDLEETIKTIGRAVTLPADTAFKEETAPIPVESIIEPEKAEKNADYIFIDEAVSVMGTLPAEEPINSDESAEAESADEDTLPPPDIVYVGNVDIPFDYITPVTGRITSKFGYRDHPVDGEYKFHYGIDIAADTGDPILCFADGEVTFVGVGEINGNYMKITHSDGFVTMYAHCDSIDVKVGDKVTMGERIAYAGSTGTVSGSHLHFQIYTDGMLIDPALYLDGLTWA